MASIKVGVKNATVTSGSVEKPVHKNVKWLEELKRRESCRNGCGDEYLIKDMANGALVCEQCGIVVEERMICDEAEWRNFESDSIADRWSKCRTGDAEMPFLSADYNLGTVVRAAADTKSQPKTSASFAGNIVNQYKRRSVDNALIHAYKEIKDIGDRINLPDSVLHLAKYIYTKMYKKIKLKGNILLTDAKTAACVYIACRQENCYRSTREIAGIYAVNKRDLHAAIRRILNTLDMTKSDDGHATELIDRFACHLQFSREIRKRARKIAQTIEQRTTKRKIAPETIAGVSIYLAAAAAQGKPFLFKFQLLKFDR